MKLAEKFIRAIPSSEVVERLASRTVWHRESQGIAEGLIEAIEDTIRERQQSA